MWKIQFWKKLFAIGFPYKHCNFWPLCQPVKMASKTVRRSILSYENSRRARLFYWIHMRQVSCILLGSALPNSLWVVISPPGVREGMGSIPVGDSDFSLSHARVMLNISSFTPNYRAQNSPSSFTYHNFVFVVLRKHARWLVKNRVCITRYRHRTSARCWRSDGASKENSHFDNQS